MKAKKRVVVDSSIIAKWVNTENEAFLEQADKLLSEAKEDKITLFSPLLARYEVGNALLFKKKMDLPFVVDSLGTAYTFPISFIPETLDLAIETYRMAYENGVTYYDASFLALAKQENAVLVTDNPKHQGKVKEVRVIPLKDYSGF